MAFTAPTSSSSSWLNSAISIRQPRFLRPAAAARCCRGARPLSGNVVGFVLRFNFMAGFAYVAAAIGLYLWQCWAAFLSAAITLATVIAFGLHALFGGAFAPGPRTAR